MPINTNFAPAESLIYKGWYVQQRRKKRNRLPVSITQVFINLESTASAYYKLAEPWVASGDFEIEADFTVDDLAPIDEFHTRGRESTLELAAHANPVESDLVLDVGCGLGGTARHLAAVGPSRYFSNR